MNALSIRPGELTREQVLDAVSTTFDGVLDAHAKGDELPELDTISPRPRRVRAALGAHVGAREEHPEVCS